MNLKDLSLPKVGILITFIPNTVVSNGVSLGKQLKAVILSGSFETGILKLKYFHNIVYYQKQKE